MRQHTTRLTLVSPAAEPAATGCRSRGCELPSAAADGLCAACQPVYATAEALYRSLVARDLAQMERRTPGIGCAALAALYERITRTDPTVDRAHRRAPDGPRWTPEDWELDRLDAFIAELRATVTAAGEAS